MLLWLSDSDPAVDAYEAAKIKAEWCVYYFSL